MAPKHWDSKFVTKLRKKKFHKIAAKIAKFCEIETENLREKLIYVSGLQTVF